MALPDGKWSWPMALPDGIARWHCPMANGAGRWHCPMALPDGIARWSWPMALPDGKWSCWSGIDGELLAIAWGSQIGSSEFAGRRMPDQSPPAPSHGRPLPQFPPTIEPLGPPSCASSLHASDRARRLSDDVPMAGAPRHLRLLLRLGAVRHLPSRLVRRRFELVAHLPAAADGAQAAQARVVRRLVELSGAKGAGGPRAARRVRRGRARRLTDRRASWGGRCNNTSRMRREGPKGAAPSGRLMIGSWM